MISRCYCVVHKDLIQKHDGSDLKIILLMPFKSAYDFSSNHTMFSFCKHEVLFKCFISMNLCNYFKSIHESCGKFEEFQVTLSRMGALMDHM